MVNRPTTAVIFPCCAIIGLCLAATSSPALAADEPANTVVFVGVSGLQTTNLRHEIQAGVHIGFTAALDCQMSDWFGIAGEVGGNYETLVFADKSKFYSRFVTMAAGPEIFHRVGRVTPFVQVLAGLAVMRGGRSESFRANDGGFVVQPGLGLDVWISKSVGLRAEADYRRLSTTNAHDDQYRGSAGVVIGW